MYSFVFYFVPLALANPLLLPLKRVLLPPLQHIFSISKVNQIKYFWHPLKTATGGEERNSSGAAEKDYEQTVEQAKYDLKMLILVVN